MSRRGISRFIAGSVMFLSFAVGPQLLAVQPAEATHFWANSLNLTVESSGGTYLLPVRGFIGTVNWGDQTATSCTPTACTGLTHTYASAGTYNIKIGTGNGDTLSGFGGGCNASVSYGTDIIRVDSWGDYVSDPQFTYLGGAFAGQTRLTDVPATFPSYVTNVECMFSGATIFNDPDVTSWNTTPLTTMRDMFWAARDFNQPIGNWDTSHVTNMSGVFAFARTFNQNIETWNTQSVTNFEEMFRSAIAFNQPIASWNTSSALSMGMMFMNALAFNKPLGGQGWDTSHVQSMQSMFEGAASFNQPLNTWNVEDVQYMRDMFYGATSFNQPLGSWNIQSLIDAQGILENTALSPANYDSLLRGWVTSTMTSVPFSTTARYTSSGSTAREFLISSGWTISDGGLYVAPTSSPTPAPSSTSTAASLPSTGMNSQLLLLTATSGFGLLLLGIFLRRIRRVKQD